MLLSLEWRFSRDRFLTPALLGYDKVEIPGGHGGHKKVLQINEEEAKTVRLIYYLLLNGYRYRTAEVADIPVHCHFIWQQRIQACDLVPSRPDDLAVTVPPEQQVSQHIIIHGIIL